jgi:acyl-CoA thioesterase
VSADLGLTLVEAGPGRGVVRGVVTPAWLNGFGIVHGGTVCTIADTALALACNGEGVLTVGAGLDVTWVSPGRVGDVLVASAVQRARYGRDGRNGLYDITVSRDDGSLVAEVRGRTRTVGGPVPTTLAEGT